LSKINVPTLIVWARQDPLVPLEPSSGALHNGIAGSKLLIVDDSGHLTHEEQPVPLLEQIAAFLA
jgi:pimeloyl-ACP methyl ester carboxylesterase